MSSEASATFELRDLAGVVVANGDIQLPSPFPPTKSGFTGAWNIKTASSSFPMTGIGKGNYQAGGDATRVSINFTPIADNNIILEGPPTPQGLIGDWKYATFAGAKTMGTFSITLK